MKNDSKSKTGVRLFNLGPLLLIKIYKTFLSPLLPRACRFEPTCSIYAMQCFKEFSFFKALMLTIKRIGRCHPFCEGGYDPIPTSATTDKERSI